MALDQAWCGKAIGIRCFGSGYGLESSIASILSMAASPAMPIIAIKILMYIPGHRGPGNFYSSKNSWFIDFPYTSEP